jgi:hypothetical protein
MQNIKHRCFGLLLCPAVAHTSTRYTFHVGIVHTLLIIGTADVRKHTHHMAKVKKKILLVCSKSIQQKERPGCKVIATHLLQLLEQKAAIVQQARA